MNNIRKIVGENIRYYRLKKGLSQEQLGEEIRTDNGTISRFERGVMSPNVEVIQKIADALNVPAYKFLMSPRNKK